MSKPQPPSTSENIKRQLSFDETFEVFEQVFPRVMQLDEFKYKMLRLAADYGSPAVDLTVELLERYGVRTGDELPAERRRNFYAIATRVCELLGDSNPGHNGECC